MALLYHPYISHFKSKIRITGKTPLARDCGISRCVNWVNLFKWERQGNQRGEKCISSCLTISNEAHYMPLCVENTFTLLIQSPNTQGAYNLKWAVWASKYNYWCTGSMAEWERQYTLLQGCNEWNLGRGEHCRANHLVSSTFHCKENKRETI